LSKFGGAGEIRARGGKKVLRKLGKIHHYKKGRKKGSQTLPLQIRDERAKFT